MSKSEVEIRKAELKNEGLHIQKETHELTQNHKLDEIEHKAGCQIIVSRKKNEDKVATKEKDRGNAKSAKTARLSDMMVNQTGGLGRAVSDVGLFCVCSFLCTHWLFSM
jgi:hypothetical protein